MLYLSGIHALNVTCDLKTCGDWHSSALQWDDLVFLDSEKSIFGDYGIEINKSLPHHDGYYNVANHIRALLDLLQRGNFSIAQGMKNDFICNDELTEEIFNKVLLLENEKHWSKIDKFMSREYLSEWISFKDRRDID